MLGAIIGDIVGSRFEFDNHKSKDFEMFTYDCQFTDDSVMTLAVGLSILSSEKDVKKLPEITIAKMQKLGRYYSMAGYGGMFNRWLFTYNPQPYNSYGNGSAMRVSACGFMGDSLEEVKQLAYAVTKISHNHPEGLKGAESVAVAIYLARTGKTVQEIKEYITKHYYSISFTLDEIRPTYRFNETCQDTVPQALQAFFESTDFEDAIRNAISIGGDSDTIGAITGAVAEAYYGIPEEMKRQAYTYLDKNLMQAVKKCYMGIGQDL